MKALGLIVWTSVLATAFTCMALLAVSGAATPRGVGRPLALADVSNPEAIAKRAERKADISNDTLSRQIDALASRQDLLRKDFDAFVKDCDARFARPSQPAAKAAETADVQVIHGFTPTWFECVHCPRVKKESEANGLPFRVEWSEIDQAGLKALGIPANVGFPCFHWQDGTGGYRYFWNDGSTGKPTTMQALEEKWKEHR